MHQIIWFQPYVYTCILIAGIGSVSPSWFANDLVNHVVISQQPRNIAAVRSLKILKLYGMYFLSQGILSIFPHGVWKSHYGTFKCTFNFPLCVTHIRVRCFQCIRKAFNTWAGVAVLWPTLHMVILFLFFRRITSTWVAVSAIVSPIKSTTVTQSLQMKECGDVSWEQIVWKKF